MAITASESSSKHDFDILVGGWKIRNRKLKEPLAGCDEWDEFAPDNMFPTGLKRTIRRNGDHLVWQAIGRNALQGALDIYPESETNFFLKINDAQLTFIKNDKSEVTAVIHPMAGLPDSEGKKLKNE